MKILQLFQYVYIFFAAIFLYDGIVSWNDGSNRSYISFLFVVLAIFMFFFRKRFRKKFNDRNK
ncbi:hypothetical protein [uncultured Psychroserpens sp.]|uniref:hypothetical protein n=1 Tax=uncultured Psychroserpens sp. TaxID=255436 RepID=UPI002633C17F|nr:hypothetical protein [uncultured Psychroserpens sp.]